LEGRDFTVQDRAVQLDSNEAQFLDIGHAKKPQIFSKGTTSGGDMKKFTQKNKASPNDTAMQ